MTARLDWSRLHSKILRSSIWTEAPMVRLVWICALADSDTNGVFYGSPDVLARAWNLKVQDVEDGLHRLQEPDPDSHTKDYEGRRVLLVGENEWKVVNKRAYNPSGEPVGASTERVRRYRERKSASETGNGWNEGNARNDLEERRGEEEESKSERREEQEVEEGVVAAAAAPSATEGSGIVFLTSGVEETWEAPEELVKDLERIYPDVGVRFEMEKAAAKVRNKAVPKKTARGMPKFLHNWMERSQNQARGDGPGRPQAAVSARQLVGSQGEPFVQEAPGLTAARLKMIAFERNLPEGERRVTTGWSEAEWEEWERTGVEPKEEEL